jgi:hypothetical protein
MDRLARPRRGCVAREIEAKREKAPHAPPAALGAVVASRSFASHLTGSTARSSSPGRAAASAPVDR